MQYAVVHALLYVPYHLVKIKWYLMKTDLIPHPQARAMPGGLVGDIPDLPRQLGGAGGPLLRRVVAGPRHLAARQGRRPQGHPAHRRGGRLLRLPRQIHVLQGEVHLWRQ